MGFRVFVRHKKVCLFISRDIKKSNQSINQSKKKKKKKKKKKRMLSEQEERTKTN